jgi:hypothetical protein
MIVLSLFPGGAMQLYDVLQNGYWHARGHEYLSTSLADRRAHDICCADRPLNRNRGLGDLVRNLWSVF